VLVLFSSNLTREHILFIASIVSVGQSFIILAVPFGTFIRFQSLALLLIDDPLTHIGNIVCNYVVIPIWTIVIEN